MALVSLGIAQNLSLLLSELKQSLPAVANSDRDKHTTPAKSLQITRTLSTVEIVHAHEAVGAYSASSPSQ